MTPESSIDIVGNNAAVALGTGAAAARSITLTAIGGNARFGDVNVGPGRGTQLPQNVPVRFDANQAHPADRLTLANCFVYVPSGTTVTISWLL